MKLFKEVIKNNLKLMIIYVILGITFTFLGLYATNYFQVIIDSFGTNTTTISMIIFYGIILLVTAIITRLSLSVLSFTFPSTWSPIFNLCSEIITLLI